MLLRSIITLGLLLALPSCTHVSTDASDKIGRLDNRLVEQFVEVDGFKLRTRTSGLAERRPGEPVIVFENGSLAPLESWASIPDRASELAPVVLYDRATVGGSEWDGKVSTPSHVADRLGKLLRALDAPPPYVLVGWSWGGDLIRYHAADWGEDVVGLVYVDPAVHSPAAELALMERLGFGEEGLKKKTAFLMKQAKEELSEKHWADVAFIDQLLVQQREHDYGTVPPVPMVVIVAGSRRTPSETELEKMKDLPLSMLEEHRALLPGKIDRLEGWVRGSNNGILIYSERATHFLQGEEPDLIMTAITRVLAAHELESSDTGTASE